MRLTGFDELPVVDRRGTTVGRVSHALFDPARPALVGFEVRLPRLGRLVERQRRYVPLTGVTVHDDRLSLAEGERLQTLRDTRSGISWEHATIWKGMPVRSSSGVGLGEVKDA
ncbi:MAG TPA: PRC-barrel domain-containing protein, partial [Coriobacteriia bacterium]|nr:PRC-barrel domain-containing protein [Coriobacteriia bacterium]